MKTTIVFLCLLMVSPALAQKQAAYWYWANNRGVHFPNNGGDPEIIYDGKTNGQVESAAAISDSAGNLLFYASADGANKPEDQQVTIWNKQHNIMANGTQIMGDNSAQQGTLVVPDPGSPHRYYLFSMLGVTFRSHSNTGSLWYSIVDMRLDGGLGEVVVKNKIVADSNLEGMTGTLHCNGKDYWVVSATNKFKGKSVLEAILVTEKGIDTIIYSELPSGIDLVGANFLKLSPNGKMIVTEEQENRGTMCLFDFDNKTGKVGKRHYLRPSRPRYAISVHTACFSPDNTKLYHRFAENIVQYDLTTIATADTLYWDSVGIIPNYNNQVGLQLAPNGRIYCYSSNKDPFHPPAVDIYLSEIKYPNLKGVQCTFIPLKYYIATPIYSEGALDAHSLPNFMDYIFNQDGIPALARCEIPRAATLPDTGCVGNVLHFVDKSTYNPLRRTWIFDGGNPATSTDSIVSVTYEKAGTYNVRLIAVNDNGSDTVYTEAVVYPNPIAKAGADKNICPTSSTQLGDKPEPGNKYSWQPTTNLDDATLANPTASPTTNMQYILTVTSEHGCAATDTVLVTIGTIVAKVSSDTAICSGSSVQLIASGGAEYVWSPSVGLSNSSIENPIATPTITTQYKVIVSSGTCKDSAFITITVNPQPTADAGPDQTICSGEPVNIGVPAIAGNTYSWQPPTGLSNATISNPTASPTITTEYILTVTSNGCIAFDTVVVKVGNLIAKVSGDVSICAGKTAQLLASGGAKYVWSPSDGLNDTSIPNPTASPSTTTRYKVVVSSGSCIDSAFVTVTIAPPPIVDAGNDRVICVGKSTQIGTAAINGNIYAWSPSIGLVSPLSSQTTASPTTTTTYTLTVTNPAGCVNYDTITVTVNPLNERSFTLQPDTVIITPGQQFRVNLNVSSGVSDWGVRLGYNPRLVKYNSINNGLQAIADNQKGELVIRGTTGNTTSSITFEAFLPHTSDTIYAVKLSIDTTQATPCETSTAIGNILKLSDYCGKNIRVVSATGKSYFLAIKGNTIDFGVGLSGNVRLEVFDYLGNSMQVLNDGNLEAGAYSAEIDLPTGVYFCRMRAGLFESVRKVLIAR